MKNSLYVLILLMFSNLSYCLNVEEYLESITNQTSVCGSHKTSLDYVDGSDEGLFKFNAAVDADYGKTVRMVRYNSDHSNGRTITGNIGMYYYKNEYFILEQNTDSNGSKNFDLVLRFHPIDWKDLKSTVSYKGMVRPTFGFNRIHVTYDKYGFFSRDKSRGKCSEYGQILTGDRDMYYRFLVDNKDTILLYPHNDYEVRYKDDKVIVRYPMKLTKQGAVQGDEVTERAFDPMFIYYKK